MPDWSALRRDPAIGATADVFAAALLVVIGAAGAWLLGQGDPIRFVLALPVLFFAPGYLLIQAAIGPTSRSSRGLHALVAIGVSPALVGLLALATSLVPGGFRAGSILIVVTTASLLLAALALYRRLTPSPRGDGRGAGEGA